MTITLIEETVLENALCLEPTTIQRKENHNAGAERSEQSDTSEHVPQGSLLHTFSSLFETFILRLLFRLIFSLPLIHYYFFTLN